MKAYGNLHERLFGGRIVKATFYNEKDYKNRAYNNGLVKILVVFEFVVSEFIENYLFGKTLILNLKFALFIYIFRNFLFSIYF